MTSIEKARLKLLTVVAPARLEAVLVELLQAQSVNGYTATKATGFGQHGESRAGLISAGNLRLEVLVQPNRSDAILKAIVERFPSEGVIAFTADVDAVPLSHWP
ncbi:MAG TPA: DUF3240 family protein [Polyangiaceae bacterium]|jgi:nitrogen regulatory protein PII|nr:DUF3240 family protein [Polyangiaceae bacterium]